MLLIVSFGVPAAGTRTIDESPNHISPITFVPGQFIVKLNKDIPFTHTMLSPLNTRHQVYSLEKLFPQAKNTILDSIYLLHVPLQSDILSIVQDYACCPDVQYAEPNYIGMLCTFPDDTNFTTQWSLHNTGQFGIPDCDIDAPEAWDLETGTSEVTIAIIDTGIDDTHPDLQTKIWTNTDELPGNDIDDDNNGYIDDTNGWDCFYNDSDPDDGYGHGTFCAGIAAAATNNSNGIAGVSWNCTFMPVKIINRNGEFSDTITAKGIVYAADNQANVISMSFTFLDSDLLQDAVNYATAQGAVLCAAAGNQNSPEEHYPAAYPNVIAVAATTQNDTRCSPADWGEGSGSNYGAWVDIAAPGNLIYSTMPTYHVSMNDHGHTKNYTTASGTSASCPMVAGVAALLLSKNPLLSPDEIKTLLCENTDPYNSTEYIGAGRLNAYKTLNALNQPPTAQFTWTPQNPHAQQPITFDASTSYDPDGTIILYEWDWNQDGIYEENHTTPTATHQWEQEGDYPVTVQVTDQENATDHETKTVTINGSISFLIDITGGYGITATLTNNGTMTATTIHWTISVIGGILLLGRTKSGTLAPLQPGSTTTIKDTPLVGIGRTIIRVDVTCNEAVSATQTTNATIILFFVIGIT